MFPISPEKIILLVSLHPSQLRSGEIARRIEKMLKAFTSSELRKRFIANLYRSGVTPDDGRADRLDVLVNDDQTVHLIGDADGDYTGEVALEGQIAETILDIAPPHFRVLLSEALERGAYQHFCAGILG